METTQIVENQNFAITGDYLLEHWQGHRALTRKVIEAYPEDQFFIYSLAGMRPFSELIIEIIDLAEGGIEGIATGKWGSPQDWRHTTGKTPSTKAGFLKLWDEISDKINSLWPTITEERFNAVEKAFGIYDGTNYSSLLYFIDNEIHHRGQAYVYLRSLGKTPPPFWERD